MNKAIVLIFICGVTAINTYAVSREAPAIINLPSVIEGVDETVGISNLPVEIEDPCAAEEVVPDVIVPEVLPLPIEPEGGISIITPEVLPLPIEPGEDDVQLIPELLPIEDESLTGESDAEYHEEGDSGIVILPDTEQGDSDQPIVIRPEVLPLPIYPEDDEITIITPETLPLPINPIEPEDEDANCVDGIEEELVPETLPLPDVIIPDGPQILPLPTEPEVEEELSPTPEVLPPAEETEEELFPTPELLPEEESSPITPEVLPLPIEPEEDQVLPTPEVLPLPIEPEVDQVLPTPEVLPLPIEPEVEVECIVPETLPIPIEPEGELIPEVLPIPIEPEYVETDIEFIEEPEEEVAVDNNLQIENLPSPGFIQNV